jgi:endonuclease YncB( thermonuclease family)
MAGYDTPEMKPPKTKPDRDMEKARALRAKQALLTHLVDLLDPLSSPTTNAELDAAVAKNRRTIPILCKEFDKYGRLLVEVVLEDVGSVNEWMVHQGFGYAYGGGAKDVTFATRT